MILRTLFATSKQFAAWQTLDGELLFTHGDRLNTPDAGSAEASLRKLLYCTKCMSTSSLHSHNAQSANNRHSLRCVRHTDALPSEAPTSAAFVPVPADMQAGSELPAATPALHTRSAGSSSSDETLPQTKRQKLDPVHDHNQQANHVPANTTSAADASDSFTDTIGPGSKNGVKRHASQPADVTNESEEEGGLSSQEDESLGNDSEGGQLGNISIADSSEDVLSHAMLHALEAAIQHRLQQYATPSVDAEQKALKRTQEAAVW